MEKQKNTPWEWVQTHKKELAIAGITIGVAALAFLGIKLYGDELLAHLEELLKETETKKLSCSQKTAFTVGKTAVAQATERIAEKSITTTITETITAVATELPAITEPRTIAPHDVSSCIVKLPEGRHASPEKIATAAANGFDLLPPNTTWREAYSTGKKAA